MSDITTMLHHRMNEFDRQQKLIIACQARCEEQISQQCRESHEMQHDLKRLLVISERHKGSMTTIGIFIGTCSGILGAGAEWLIHYMGFFTWVGMVLLGSFTGILGAAADWAVHHLHWLG